MEGGGKQTASLYEILFSLQVQICERFNISPFQVRRERFSEFCLLVARLKNYSQKAEKAPKTITKKDGKEKKYLPVMDYKPIRKEVAHNG